jgi:hypothetical protein
VNHRRNIRKRFMFSHIARSYMAITSAAAHQ